MESFIDPVFRTKITRITGDPGTAIPVVGGKWGNIARHNYSKDAVWNADQSLLLLKTVWGASGYLFLDGETYQPVFTRGGVLGETRWHPTQPDVMNYLTPGCQVGRWNVRSNTKTAVMTLTGYKNCQLGPWEGNFSHDGNSAAVQATRSSDSRKVAFAANLATKTKGPDIDLARNGVSFADWVGISPKGRYIVANGAVSGGTAIGGYKDNTKVFTIDGRTQGDPWREYGVPSHYDMTLDVAGNEVAVGVAKTGPHAGKVIMRRLKDGGITVLSKGGYATHTSTRSDRVWAYVSHENADTPYKGEVFAAELKSAGTVARLAHLRAKVTDYDTYPIAVPSPDGKRVIFASNWNSSTGRPVQAYVVDFRSLCTPR
jgi:hypothetical protein